MMPQMLLSWQTTLQLESTAVKFRANARLGGTLRAQLLVWLFPFYQPQEMDYLHPHGGVGRQDMLFSWIQCTDEYSPPTQHQIIQFLQEVINTERAYS